MKKRIYLGNAKKNDEYDLINGSICLSDIPKEFINEYQGKKYLPITIGSKKEIDQYGKTHSIWINEYKPDQEEQPKRQAPAVKSLEDEDLPF
jgi:hypothetical protein